MSCSSKEGGQCPKPGTMQHGDKKWCATHYMRRAKKAKAQKRRRLEAKEAAVVQSNPHLDPALSAADDQSAEGLMNTLRVAFQANHEHFRTTRGLASTESIAVQSSAKSSTAEKSTASETTSYDRDGVITSVKRDVINETKVSLEQKFKVVREVGFKMTEIEEFSKTNSKLLSGTPTTTFRTNRPLMDDDEIFILGPPQMAIVDANIQRLVEVLRFESFDAMALASSEEAVKRVFANWEAVSPVMMTAQAVAYIPFFIYYAYQCGRVLIGTTSGSRELKRGANALFMQRANTVSPTGVQIEDFFLGDLAQSLFDITDTSSQARELMHSLEVQRLNRIHQYKVNGIGYEPNEGSIEREAKRVLGNLIAYYIDRRVEHACCPVKPERAIPPMPYFITRSLTRRKQYIETKMEDIEFDYSFQVDGLCDPIANKSTSPYFETKLNSRSAACFETHRMKQAVEEHADVFLRTGCNVLSKRAHQAFNTFMTLATNSTQTRKDSM